MVQGLLIERINKQGGVYVKNYYTGYYVRSVIFVFLAFLSMSAAHAADKTHALAKASQNPISSLISVPFEFNNNFNTGPEDAYFQQLLIKPVDATH